MKFYFKLIAMGLKSATSMRAAFLLEMFFMMANNFIFLALWAIFFKRFTEVKGWTLQDMIILNAVGMGGYGLMLLCFGGVRRFSTYILEGEMDILMTQPKNLLLHLLVSRSQSKGFGNLMTAILLIFLGKLTSLATLSLILLGMISSALIFTSMGVIAHSMVFWFGNVDSVSRRYCDSLFLFALYPTHIYSGMVQLMMFTVIPAGLIGFLPVELVRNFSLDKLILLIGSTALFVFIAYRLFYCGLARYESGSQVTVRR